LVLARKYAACSGLTSNGLDFLANDFNEFDDLCRAGDGMNLEPSSFCPRIGIVMMGDVAKDRLFSLLIYDDAQVTVDPYRPKIFLPRLVNAVQRQAGSRWIRHIVENYALSSGLLGVGKPIQATMKCVREFKHRCALPTSPVVQYHFNKVKVRSGKSSGDLKQSEDGRASTPAANRADRRQNRYSRRSQDRRRRTVFWVSPLHFWGWDYRNAAWVNIKVRWRSKLARLIGQTVALHVLCRVRAHAHGDRRDPSSSHGLRTHGSHRVRAARSAPIPRRSGSPAVVLSSSASNHSRHALTNRRRPACVPAG